MNLITFSYFAICKQANPRIPIIPGHEIFLLAKWNNGTKTGERSVKELELSLKTNELEIKSNNERSSIPVPSFCIY
jgi:hypothetical protein